MKKGLYLMKKAICFLLILAAAASAPAVEPFMIIRFRSGQHEDDVRWQETLDMLKQYRQGCDEVWFSTGIGIPPLAWHEAQAQTISAAARQLRAVGIVPSLQIQATLGHSDRISALADMSAKTWGGFTGPDGTECKLNNCPRQPGFLKYCAEMARIHASWKPGSIWIDDDLRMTNHLPVKTGCYCSTCVAAFSEEEGRVYTRESLVAAIKKDVRLSARWDASRHESLAQVARVIAKAVHEVSPDTRMGYQHCMTPGRDQIFRALNEASGHKVGSRPGGGVYSDHNPRDLIRKAFLLSTQMGTQPGYELLDRICPEIESCPRCFSCKTAHGLAVESLLYLAMGTNCLSYFIMDAELESPEWYGSALMSELASDAPLFKDYVRFNEGTMPGGVGGGSPHLVACIGLPLCGESPFPSGRLLTYGSARTLPDAEIHRYLAGGVLLDGQAIEVLQKRGFSDEMGGLTVTPAEPGLREAFTEDALNEGIVNGRHSAYRGRFYRITATSETARVVGRYYRARNGEDAGVASVLTETPSGGRIAAFGCDGLSVSYVSRNRIRQLLRAADWITRGTLPALAESATQCMIVPRVTKSGELRSVAVLNTVIDRQVPFELRLRGCPEKLRTAKWIAIGERPLDIVVRHEEEDAFVTVPVIAAWNMGWLRLVH